MIRKKFVVLGMMSALVLGACSDSNSPRIIEIDNESAPANDGTQTITEIATADADLSTLTAALQATQLDSVLADRTRSFTVFAPTNDAFDKLGADTVNALLADTDTLSDILLYHVLADTRADAATAISLAGSSVTAANGDDLQISLDGARLFINESEVVVTDIAAVNGIVHVIDTVLSPPEEPANDATQLNLVDTALAAGSFNTLAAALEATDLISVLADESASFTVFAPTDEAFAALGQDTIDSLLADPDALRNILLYHVISGEVDASTAVSLAGSKVTMVNGDESALTLNEGQLMINMANVVATDVQASNGIIHVIDSVMLPPSPEPALGNIVDTAVSAGFTTLVAALQATGLDATLSDESSTFTVFAPTDDAFAKLGADTINSLLANPDQLSDILLYHVVAGAAVDATTAISLAGTNVEMANGSSTAITLDGSNLLINQSMVVVTDVMASNGIIHVIDTVLLPPADVPAASNLIDTAREAGNFTTLVAALEATGLDVAIGHGNDMYTVFAPTDAAFAALGTDTINALLADPETLRNILLYHVIAGTAVDAATAVSKVGVSIEMANGGRIVLTQTQGDLFINKSRIIQTDVRASNGIIHAIDAVLIPVDTH